MIGSRNSHRRPWSASGLGSPDVDVRHTGVDVRRTDVGGLCTEVGVRHMVKAGLDHLLSRVRGLPENASGRDQAGFCVFQHRRLFCPDLISTILSCDLLVKTEQGGRERLTHSYFCSD